ncbi:DUF6745 domain-containing protein [Aulosira sp. FACHB-615]|uniref:DUF6745 domain-containing protein n=1 Tax=Aulosira sp. FACHB-615 TaxID=2692777 RepID=UPI0016847D9B|nr:hypothetical protein [Aulosira sp. FACHB-615]MBD2490739.1 hypothetical protein [Aulosira sp. FACHB-615]
MSNQKSKKLTPEQEALILNYWQKWRNIAFSTEAINNNVLEFTEKIYSLVNKRSPQIILCNSPYAAINEMLLLNSSQCQLNNNLVGNIEKIVNKQLKDFWKQTLLKKSSSNHINYLLRSLDGDDLEFYTDNPFNLLNMILSGNQSELVWRLWSKKINYVCISPFNWIYIAATFDFFISELNCYYDPDLYQVVQQVLLMGGIIFPFNGFCFVCDRSTKLSFDHEYLLHAEGEAAVQFADGYSIYAYHGVRLPDKYGKLHPEEWQPKWLLEEKNAELRRVLIQGIGYSRIIEQLQAVELDSWQEYTLLKINSDIDIEPISLLKMTCPSTQRIHVLRVPPDIKSAQDGISWINWGIAPEEFSVQT